jgi:hypothetical protein
MSYRWAKVRSAGIPTSWAHNVLFFHDLLIDGRLMAWVREDRRCDPPMFLAGLSRPTDHQVFPATRDLATAKAQVIHYFVTQRMETK